MLASRTLASSSRSWARNTVRPFTTPSPSTALGEKPPRLNVTRQPRPRPRSPRSTTNTKASPAAPNLARARSAERSRQVVSRSRSSAAEEEAPHHGKRERSLLQPYELSARLVELCEKGDIDLAVATLERAPRNAQNIKVWNTLIQKCMYAKKYKLAYSVFTDMKRRGFVPNVRTYATMMSGYATIEDWEMYSKQLASVHSVYDQLRRHIIETPRVVVNDPAGESGASFILFPIALYISILGKTSNYQKAFDVFHELDTNGSLAPHSKVYSSLLCVLADRVDSMDTHPTAIAQSVSEAKYVWRRHMRSVDKNPHHTIEPRSVEAMIKVLSRGEPTDHELMFDILHDICGLPRPHEEQGSSPSPPPSPAPAPAPAPAPPPPKVAPTSWILGEALDGCITAGHPDKALHYAQSVMSAPKLRPILHGWHLSRLLVAHLLIVKDGGSTSPERAENAAEWVERITAQARDKRTAPNMFSLGLALELCHLCEDIHSALRMTRAVLEGPLRGSMPVKAWAYLLRLAIVAPPEEKRQCLELLNTHRSVLDVWELSSSSAAKGSIPIPPRKTRVSLALSVVQLLRAVPPSPDHNSAERPDTTDLEQQHKVWSDLRRRAESFLEKHK